MTYLILLALSLQLPTPAAPPVVPSAVVNVPRLVAESIVGKALSEQLQAFQSTTREALTEKRAALDKLSASKALPAQIERARIELQRFTEDAQVDYAALSRQLQLELDTKLRPVLSKIAVEEHIGILFEYPQPSIVWTTPAVDITAKVIECLDAAAKEKKPN